MFILSKSLSSHLFPSKMDSQAIKTPVTIPFCFLGLLCKKLTGHEPDNPQFGELNES